MATSSAPAAATTPTSITPPEPRDSCATSLREHCHEVPKAANSPKYCSTRCKKGAAKGRSKAAETPPTAGGASQITNNGREGRKVAIDIESESEKVPYGIETDQTAKHSSSKRSSKSSILLSEPADSEDLKKLAHEDAIGEGDKDDSDAWETEEEEDLHDSKVKTRRLHSYRKAEKAFLDAVLPSMRAEMMAETFGWKAASSMDPAAFGYNFYSD